MTTAKTTIKTRASAATKPVPRKTPATKAAPKAGKGVSAVDAKLAATKPAAPKPAAPKQTAEAGRVKHKLVRDSFTIPKSEYAVLDALKLRAAKLARPTKKSEVLRAGVAALAAMSDKAFLAALELVPSLKTGRPKGP